MPFTSSSREIIIRPPSKELGASGVLQVVDTLEPHGRGRAAVDVAKALARLGARSVIASAGGYLVSEARVAGVEHVDIKSFSANPVRMMRLSGQLARIVKEHDIDVVHARHPLAAWPSLRAAKRAGKKSVSTISEPLSSVSGWLSGMYARALTETDYVVSISDFIADQVKGERSVAEGKLSVIHRGIDLARFNPGAVKGQRLIELARRYNLPDDRMIVLFAGSLAPRNGIEVLIDAFAKLERPDVFCLIVGSEEGSGEDTARLEKRIQDANLGGKVRLGGHCDDMPAAYMLSDVVAVPTVEPEAFGRVCVEAQAMGRPVVASSLGGAKETVIEGETGWLVPPGEAEPLAAALTRALLLDVGERRDMAMRTRSQMSERFSVERMCAQTLSLYDRMLSEQ